MKKHTFSLIGLIVVLTLLFSSTGVSAATLPPGSELVPPQQTGAPTAAGAVDNSIFAQAIAMGKPGTVYGYARTFGHTDQAYPDNPGYLNGPASLVRDGDGNIIIAEENGAQIAKYNSTGTRLWTVGTPGMHDFMNFGADWPHEVAIAPDGNIWVGDNQVLTRISPDGSQVTHFPEEPWNVYEGDPFWFREIRGIAFDVDGRMYVSDRNTNRVGVFTFDVEGNPVPAGGLNSFNQPFSIAIDGTTLYISELGEWRIRKCTPTGDTWPWDWNCSVWFNNTGLVVGLGQWNAGHLLVAQNLPTDTGWTHAILDCQDVIDTASCTQVVDGLNWAADAALDPTTGNVLALDYNQSQLRVFTSAGAVADPMHDPLIGSPDGRPYEDMEGYYNNPSAVEVDKLGNVFITEDSGARLTKLSPAGVKLWSVGSAGQPGQDASAGQLQNPQAVAVDPLGNALVTTYGQYEYGQGNKTEIRGAQRVAIFSAATGAFISWLGPNKVNNQQEARFLEDYTFNWPTGLTVSSNGTIYVADGNRHRVMVYDKTYKLLYQIGVTDERGRDSLHLNQPMGLTTDAAGNLYVADSENFRIQKFNKLGLWVATFGTGMNGNTFDRMAHPYDVAVDKKGNIIVAEEWENRVQVFNKYGAYLTTIGQGYDSGTNDFRRVTGVAVDKTGNLYISAWNSQRVQKFTAGVTNWTQMNLNGFGNREINSIMSMGVFKNQLYAGTNGPQGARLYRMGKTGWQAMMDDGFGDGSNESVESLVEFKGYFYAGTGNYNNGAQIWRSMDGLTWQSVVWNGFDNPANVEIERLAVVNGQICAGTWSMNVAELYCSLNGEADTWQLVGGPGMGSPTTSAIMDMVGFNGNDYVVTYDNNGGQVYRHNAGESTVTAINEPGFGDPTFRMLTSLAVFKNQLYVLGRGVKSTDTEVVPAIQIWRCTLCDGSTGDWVKVNSDGFGYSSNLRAPGMIALKSALYVTVGNYENNGMMVYGSKDGTTWLKVGPDGLGDSHNVLTYYGNSLVNFKNTLYLGTVNWWTGGEVWKFNGKFPTGK